MTTDHLHEPASLGPNIRARRTELGLTLTQLAQLTGLSHPFLSQVERDLARPRLQSLARIARALGTSQIELMSGAPATARSGAAIQFVRADDAPTGTYGLGHARLLATGATRFTPMDYRAANVDPGEYFVHDEDEFLVVIEGALEVDLGEDDHQVLAAGDAVYFAGGTPHRWSSPNGDWYRIIVVKERRIASPSDATGGAPGEDGCCTDPR